MHRAKRQYLTTLLLALAGLLAAAPARADLVLRGTDYYQTTRPIVFPSLAYLGAANQFIGLPVGPGPTDTIVRRLDDCELSLSTAGSHCTVRIELVSLSLVSVTNPSITVTARSNSLGTGAGTGTMTITSDGSGTGGTYTDDFFDIFSELRIDPDPKVTFVEDDGFWSYQLTDDGTTLSINKDWSTMPPLLVADVPGEVGDQAANRHTNKATACPTGQGVCVDFYAVPEPDSAALLALALVSMGWLARANRTPRQRKPAAAH